MKCWSCSVETENIFCSGLCSRLYLDYFWYPSKTMNHSFVPGLIDRSKCAKCKRVFTDHTALAICDSCSNKGMCSYYESDDLLLCDANCAPKHETSLRESLNDSNKVKETVLDLAKRNDIAIRYNGDAFNAKTVANQEVKASIDAEQLTEAEKHYKYQQFLADRIVHFRKVMFDCDSTKYDAQLEVNAALHDLRSFATALSKDIQAKLHESDKTYTPQVNIKKAVSKKPKIDAKERLIQAFMELHKCDYDAAKRYVELGPSAVNKS